MNATLAPHSFVDRYRIDGVLGVGGFGVTYRATDTTLGRVVAVKEHVPPGAVRQDDGVLTGGLDESKWGVNRFIDESRRAASLNHPGVVKVHDVVVANGTGYLVMEYLEGPSLEDWVVAQGPLSGQDLIDVATGLSAGLSYLHHGDAATGRASILHLDVSPSNIICSCTVGGQLRTVLIDFGSSRSSAPTATGSYTRIVKDGFSAPELYNEQAPRSAGSDVFSFAATMLYFATAQPPPAIGMAQQATHAGVQIRPDLGGAFFSAIEQSLQPNNQHRHGSASELAGAMFGTSRTTTQPYVHVPSYSHATRHVPEMRPFIGNVTAGHGHFPAASPTRSSSRMALLVVAIVAVALVSALLATALLSGSNDGSSSVELAAEVAPDVAAPSQADSASVSPPTTLRAMPVLGPEESFRRYYNLLNEGDAGGAFALQSGSFAQAIPLEDLQVWIDKKINFAQVLSVSCSTGEDVAMCRGHMNFGLRAGGVSDEQTLVTMRIVDGRWTFNEYEVISVRKVAG